MSDTVSPQAFVEKFKVFAGFDWAKEEHVAVGMDAAGKVLLDRAVQETAEGWQGFRTRLSELTAGDLSKVAVAVETCNGPAVERLLEMGCHVFPLNPKAARRYRERKVVSGAKSDHADALSFADALRTDGHGWRELVPDEPLTRELRMLCRDEVTLIQQRTALVVALEQALHEYYPAALEAFDDWTHPGAWAFVLAFPTPQELVQAKKRKWDKFLHAHKLYRTGTYQRRIEIFARADQFCGSAAVTAAKSLLAQTYASQLQHLEKRLQLYRARIEELFGRHPDHDIFGSLPVGLKVAPRLLSELGDVRSRLGDAQALQCLAGTAPVTFQSGMSLRVKFRRACNKHLRAAVGFLADLSRQKCVWAEVYYQRKRKQGMSHSCALRCLGQRWLKILWKMWQTRTRYNEALHTQNQVRHGSWVVTLP